MPTSRLIEIPAHEWDEQAAYTGTDLPLEQSSHWDRFDEAMDGREPWLKLEWRVDGRPRAFISLSKLRGRGFTYGWAKHGPVWVGGEPSAMDERQLISDLQRALAGESIAFVRLHLHHASDMAHELLQSVTFDRTVILDLTLGEEELLSSMKKRGRRDVRKALRVDGLEFADETAQADEVFPELYDLLRETGTRDGFGIAPMSMYLTMLKSLGTAHARLFTIRRDGAPLCWGIVTVNGPLATYYYAASSAEGRSVGAPDKLVWEMSVTLMSEGVTTFDLMGIDSERAPQLAGVRGFKTKFSEEISEVPGAWDIPTRPLLYRGLHTALKTKRGLVKALKRD